MSHVPEQKIANEMIREGATPGMVRKFLRDQGVREEQVDSIVRKAQFLTEGKTRAQGSLSLLIGMALLIASGVVLFLRIQNPIAGGGSLPIMLFVSGVVVAGRGFITMISGIRGESR
ncbi:MAG: hypothetical protein AAF456_23105 [Planctomycetota bacterium]